MIPKWRRNDSGGTGCGGVSGRDDLPVFFLFVSLGDPIGGKARYFLKSPSDWDLPRLGWLMDLRCGPDWGLFKSSSVIVKVYCLSSFMLVQSIRRWLYSAISVSSTICKERRVTSTRKLPVVKSNEKARKDSISLCKATPDYNGWSTSHIMSMS